MFNMFNSIKSYFSYYLLINNNSINHIIHSLLIYARIKHLLILYKPNF